MKRFQKRVLYPFRYIRDLIVPQVHPDLFQRIWNQVKKFPLSLFVMPLQAMKNPLSVIQQYTLDPHLKCKMYPKIWQNRDSFRSRKSWRLALVSKATRRYFSLSCSFPFLSLSLEWCTIYSRNFFELEAIRCKHFSSCSGDLAIVHLQYHSDLVHKQLCSWQNLSNDGCKKEGIT